MPDLKPCPFCGCEAEVTDTYSEYRGPYSIVFCSSCGAVGPKRRFKEDAIEAWNIRSGEEDKHEDD